MKSGKKHKVCLAVTNELVNDYRVFKEASTLSARYDVTALGFLRNNTKTSEINDNFRIVRTNEPLIRRIFVRSKSAREFVTETQMQKARQNPLSNALNILRIVANDAILYILFLNRNRCIYKGLKNIDADIYQANDIDTIKACVKTARKRGARVVYDSHELCVEEGFIKTRLFKWLMSLRERKYIRQCDAVMTVNQTIANILKKRYKLRRTPFIIRNCPDYQKTPLSKRKSKVKKILFIGVLAPTRGLEEFVLSVRYLKNAKIFIRGYGTARKSLELLAKRHKLDKKVVFLEKLPADQLIKTSTFADIGIMPYKPTSLNNTLVSPNKIYQYMMSGLAVAGSNIPEVRKVILENKVGVIFNPSSPKGIARSLSKLIDNDRLLLQCKKNSLKTATIYNWDIEGKNLLSIYQNMES